MDEVRNRWEKTIEDRAMLDYRMSSPKYGSKAIPMKWVRSTWETTGLLQTSWFKVGTSPHDGVLVGSGLESRRGEG